MSIKAPMRLRNLNLHARLNPYKSNSTDPFTSPNTTPSPQAFFFPAPTAFAFAAFFRLLLIMTILKKLPTTAEPSRIRITGIRIAQTRGGKKSWRGWPGSTKGLRVLVDRYGEETMADGTMRRVQVVW